MRFAYIDSQGNEVPIPGVDALALRIELGAITAETELFDASENRWGPAHTHEIFHTLARAQEDEGFLAPPPVPPPGGGGVEPSDGAGVGDRHTADTSDSGAPAVGGPGEWAVAEEGASSEQPAESELTAPPVEAGPPSSGGFDFGLTLTDAGGAPDLSLVDGPEPTDVPPAPADRGAGEWGLDLVDDSALAAPDDLVTEEGAAAFDFGGMDSLELEADPFDADGADAGAEETSGAIDFGGGMQLEEPLAGSMDFSGAGAGGGLELEQPMSDFNPDAPPAWMEQDGPAPRAASEKPDSMDFTPGAVESVDDPDGPAPPRERREPKNRPSPPKRPRRRRIPPALVGIVLLAGVAAAAWYGWTAFAAGGSGSGADTETTVLPEVIIPDIPAELIPQMRDLADVALAGTIRELSGLVDELGLAAEPRQDWLAGVYLANASDFGDIRAYWEGIASFSARVRDSDADIFHEQYVAAMEAANVTEETRPILLERADSGFLATRQHRNDAYARLDALTDAALSLHRFLEANEADIRYDPAAGGVSQDPVLEAVPSSEELGDEMWDRVDQITGALDAMGTLDRVTTERLTTVLFDRIRGAGVE